MDQLPGAVKQYAVSECSRLQSPVWVQRIPQTEQVLQGLKENADFRWKGILHPQDPFLTVLYKLPASGRPGWRHPAPDC